MSLLTEQIVYSFIENQSTKSQDYLKLNEKESIYAKRNVGII